MGLSTKSDTKHGVAAVETSHSQRALSYSAEKCSGLLSVTQQVICFENGYYTISQPEGNW